MSLSRVGAGALTIVLAVGLGGCGKSKSADSTSPTTAAVADSSSTTAGGSSGSALTIEAVSYKFNPATLTVKAGSSVTLVAKNGTTSTPHNFSLSEANVNQDLNAGAAAKTVTFTAPAAGDYQYFCVYHKATNNMVGTLHVTA